MDRDLIYLASFEQSLYDCIRSALKKEWNSLRSRDCTDDISANSTANFFHRTCCAKHMERNRRQLGLFKEEFRCTEMICLCNKTYCCYGLQLNKFKLGSNRLNKRTVEDTGDGPMSKYCKVLEEILKVKSINRGIRTIQHAVATYEQTKKGFSYIYPKRNVQQNGIYTHPLNIKLKTV